MSGTEAIMRGIKAGGSGPPGPHNHLIPGGVAFGFATWAVEFKEMLHAIVEPVRHCRTVGEAFWTYLTLDNAVYLGIVAWIGFFGVTTWTMWVMVRYLVSKR